MNNRNPEASALRSYFQEQWDYLQKLIEVRQANNLRQQHEREAVYKAVETIVDVTDVRLRAVASYQKKLRVSARELLDYVEELVTEIPAAVELSHSAYINDPMVNMLFRSPSEIHRLFSQTQSVQDFFKASKNNHATEVFALPFLNRSEKNILGSEMRGEIILKEVAQTSISFSGHRLVSPSATEQAARSAIQRVLFESAIQYLDRLNTQMRHTQTEAEKLNALQNPHLNIDNPEVYLQRLVEQLSLPQKLIRLQDNLLRVNTMRIKMPLDADAPGNEVRLHELEIGDEQTSVLLLVRYPLCEFQSNH